MSDRRLEVNAGRGELYRLYSAPLRIGPRGTGKSTLVEMQSGISPQEPGSSMFHTANKLAVNNYLLLRVTTSF
jgi:ABC-type branched-subunit amino acid transport system ATPase component